MTSVNSVQEIHVGQTYPKENFSLGGHLDTIVATRPANKAVQSKNM